MSVSPASLPPEPSAGEEMLRALLEVSVAGVARYQPLRNAAGDIVDFAFVYLNPAAQRLLGLPMRPTTTYCQQFPDSVRNGSMDFQRATFLTGEAGEFELTYQAGGYANYLRLAARRVGTELLVSFTDTVDNPRTAAEQNHAREQVAHAATAQQRQQLYRVFEQAPALICILQGPQHIFQFVNPPCQALVGERPLLGRSVAEAMPELVGQPLLGLLDHVYQTGETYHATEMLVQLDHANTNAPELEKRYYNFVYRPYYAVDEAIEGILAFANDVTPQVLARQQVQVLNRQLGSANDELQVANAALRRNNTELAQAQHQLHQLNQELETRVRERTQALQIARQETERQRQRLETLFMQAPAAIAILAGADFVTELVNPGFQVLLPGRVLLGQPLLTILPELVKHPAYAAMRRVYETGISHQELSQLVPLVNPTTGRPEQRYFNYVLQARFDEHGAVDGLLVFVFEVTRQVWAQQTSEASAGRLRLITDAIPALISYVDRDQRYRFVNRAYENWFHRPPAELLGQPLRAVVGEEAYQQAAGYIEQALAGEQVSFEARMPYRADFVRYIRTSFVPDSYEGQVRGFFSLVTDVTEQMQARQAADEQRQVLHKLFLAAPAPIVILDGPDLVYQLVNAAYQRIFPGRLLLGRPLLEALPELRATPVPGLLARVYETGETVVAQELPLLLARHADGPLEETIWTFTYQARHDAQGRVDGVLVFANEMTAQVQARRVLEADEQQAQLLVRELGQVNADLRRTNADLDNFIYTASHDLRQPINNIEGLLQSLLEELPARTRVGPVAYILELMHGSVERFKKTIEHLTDVARLQQEHGQPATEVHLADVVEDIRLDLAPLLLETRGHLVVDVLQCPIIPFSVKNLRSVVYNLLSNALKYHHPDREPLVRIRCRTEETHYVLSVTDNGLGLKPEHIERLFSMFQRFHNHVEGNGVGLYMVKKMVENAGGHITVESEEGVGTTFRVYFLRENA